MFRTRYGTASGGAHYDGEPAHHGLAAKHMNPIDVPPNESQWNRLTAVPEKRRAYEEDLHFREAWSEWLEMCDGEPSPVLGSVALLCAKPDAVVGRRLAPMLRYAVSRGFAPFGAVEFALTRHSMREVWRHDWHVYPVDRLAYCTAWYTSAATIGFLLRDERPRPHVPASVRLSELKGNAIAAKRKEGELRSELRPPNSVLNFVHVPDEPADILRELGILFERRERLAIMRLIRDEQARDGSVEAQMAIAALEGRYATHDLDFSAALERMVRASVLSELDAQRLMQLIREGVKLSWDELCAFADPGSPGVDRWDFISVASELIPLERDGTAGLLPGVSAADWVAQATVAAT